MSPSDDTVFVHLQACAEKCTAEQHWVVASVTAVDAAFVAAAEHAQFGLCMRLFAATILIVALVAGLCLVWLRHCAYFFYRDAIAKMLETKHYLPSELREPATRNTLSGLSGALIYSLWIIFTSAFAAAVIYTRA
jgi:hypothetical protein